MKTIQEQQPFGYYWEVVHILSGEIVNSGFNRYYPPDKKPKMHETLSIKGFFVRNTPLYKDYRYA